MKFKTIALLFACLFSAQVMVAQSTLSGPPKKPKTTTQTSKPRSNSTSKPKKQNSNRQSAKPKELSGYINGHEWVDLGLPSGLKWATCNVGATSPEGFGYYFAWGETKTKSSYTEENSTTNGKSRTWLLNNGYIDSSGNLKMSHDAAQQNWEGTWRMPTKTEINELIDNTDIVWTTIKGVKGSMLTSKFNGKSIFIPAAGGYNPFGAFYVGENGFDWGSTVCENDNDAYDFCLEPGSSSTSWIYPTGCNSRYCGRPVRAVSK